ncbi:MAG: hypothetical protein JW947_07235 [Sedimentisphaerales bacterium]|nr:hypothetical protein [Sedimentisphaerales bacterium]
MKDLKNLAKVVLIGVVVYLMLPTVLSMLFMIHILINDGLSNPFYSFLQELLPELARIFMVIIVMFLFIWKSDWIVKRIVKEDAELNVANWSPAGVYRLVIVVMGGFFIFDSVYGIASAMGSMIDYGIRMKMEGTEWGMYLMRLMTSVLLLVLGVYLLTGAPHLVKWQVRKTMEQIKELDTEKALDSAQS